MQLHQTQKLLQTKGNHQQNEKAGLIIRCLGCEIMSFVGVL